MAKITKVKSAYLERLNNAEYRTFMARYGTCSRVAEATRNRPTRSASIRTTRWASPKKFVQLSPPISPY